MPFFTIGRRALLPPLILLVILLIGVAPPARAAEEKRVSFSILKEGDPIGRERYQIQQDGDQVMVQLSVESKVHILFLDFNYHHTRNEIWNGEHLEKLIADTDDDGSKHHVEALQDPSGELKLVSDRRPIPLPADAYPLVMWRKSVITHGTLFAVESDDAPYHVTIKDIGPDPVMIGADRIECEHYAMSGDVDRDLWYDAEGMLAKVSFRRRGFGIVILRDPAPQ